MVQFSLYRFLRGRQYLTAIASRAWWRVRRIGGGAVTAPMLTRGGIGSYQRLDLVGGENSTERRLRVGWVSL